MSCGGGLQPRAWSCGAGLQPCASQAGLKSCPTNVTMWRGAACAGGAFYTADLWRSVSMIRGSLICAALVLSSVPAVARAQEAARPEPVIVTVGHATVKVPPDRAFVTIAPEAAAASPGAAQQQIARSMTAVRASLKTAGFPDDAVKTLAYGLQEEVDYQNGKRVPRGYRARNTIEVRVDDIARVGEVIDASVKAGANAVNDIRFDLKDR